VIRRRRAERELFRQGTRFAAVGLINTAFGYGLFAGLELSSGDTVPYLYLLLITHVVSVLEAYVLQRRFVFRVEGRWLTDLVRFWSVYLVALGINVVTLPFLVEIMGIPVLLAQALVLLGIAAATFIAHRNFSFRRPALMHPPDEKSRGDYR
jgi:putative flippase GtrA